MAKIEGFRIKNFRVLKDISMGKLMTLPEAEPLTPITAVIGKNGSGKSSLFDAFGFLSDCLKLGVEEACDARGRGGFERLRSKGEKGSIHFLVRYKEDDNARAIDYRLDIGLDSSGRPTVQKEVLIEGGEPQTPSRGLTILLFRDTKGIVWIDEERKREFNQNGQFHTEATWNHIIEGIQSETPNSELEDMRKLGIATLGSLKQHPRISAFRRFIDGWYLSYFTPDAARSLPLADTQKHLNIHGDNLGNVVQFMEREHPKIFQSILNRIAGKIPGIDKIDTEKTPDGRLLLRFNDKGFHDPFYAQQMSDGTLKVFAYLLLLEDPTPPPFICIEEPENGLYHKLLESLVQEFRQHATGTKGGSQVFITTHQPYLVDALSPEEVWILSKGNDGFSTITRASDDPLVKNLVDQELPLGGLWYSDYLDAR